MKKLYRKSTVHPSPPPPTSYSTADHLAFLPAAIFTLTAALTPEDKEVLAYLLSCCCSTTSTGSCKREKQQQQSDKGRAFSDHCVTFTCSCFRCYMSYWIRWDSSPNRQLIHEIIDAFEDNLMTNAGRGSGKKSRRKKGKSLGSTELTRSPLTDSVKEVQTGVVGDNEDDKDGGFSDDGLEFDKGSMRKIVSFIGDRIWGILGGKENDGK